MSTQQSGHHSGTIGLRLMVPLDESLQAQRALAYAQRIAHGTRDEVLLVRASGVETEAGYFKLSNTSDEVHLRLTSDELDKLPAFSYKDFSAPPPRWSSVDPKAAGPVLVPMVQRKRVGPEQRDLVSGARIVALDDDLGVLSSMELEPATGHLRAFWVHDEGLFNRELRVPAEWVEQINTEGELSVAGTRADVEAYLGSARRHVFGRIS